MAAFGAKFNAAQLTIAPLLAWLELVELVTGQRREVEVHQLTVTCDGFTHRASGQPVFDQPCISDCCCRSSAVSDQTGVAGVIVWAPAGAVGAAGAIAGRDRLPAGVPPRPVPSPHGLTEGDPRDQVLAWSAGGRSRFQTRPRAMSLAERQLHDTERAENACRIP